MPLATKGFVTRARLFTLLQQEIFQRPNFGIGGDMEENLTNFEAALISYGKCQLKKSAHGSGGSNPVIDKASDIYEWRRRTVECATWLVGQMQGRK